MRTRLAGTAPGVPAAAQLLAVTVIVASLAVMTVSLLLPSSGIAHRTAGGVADAAAAHNVAIAAAAAAKYDPAIASAVAANAGARWNVPGIGIPGPVATTIAISVTVVGNRLTVHASGGATAADATTSVAQQAPATNVTPH